MFELKKYVEVEMKKINTDRCRLRLPSTAVAAFITVLASQPIMAGQVASLPSIGSVYKDAIDQYFVTYAGSPSCWREDMGEVHTIPCPNTATWSNKKSSAYSGTAWYQSNINRIEADGGDPRNATIHTGNTFTSHTLTAYSNSSRQLSCPAGMTGSITEKLIHPVYSPVTINGPGSDYVVSSTINTCSKPNTAPIISGTAFVISTNEDESKTFSVGFTDPDTTDTHFFDVVSQPKNGTAVQLSGGYKYTPKANFYGTDSFQIRVRDSAGGLSATATVTVTVMSVNDLPTDITVLEGSIQTKAGLPSEWFTLQTIDADLPADSHTYTASVSPSSGEVVISGNKIKFSPAAGFSGNANVSVTTTDAAGASLTKNIPVFVREIKQLAAIQIPAIPQAIYRNGLPPLVFHSESPANQFKLTLDGEPGQSLMVGGTEILVGETRTVTPSVIKGNSYGFDISATSKDALGSVNITVESDAFGGHIAKHEISMIPVKTKLTGKKKVVQLFDQLSLTVLPETGSYCKPTSIASVAQNNEDPHCLIEWVKLPDEGESSTETVNGKSHPSIAGEAIAVGMQPVEYNVFLFDGKGNKVLVEKVSDQIEVLSAINAVQYAPKTPIDNILDTVGLFELALQKSSGYDCTPVAKAEDAMKPVRSKSCHIEWTQKPSTLAISDTTFDPRLKGYVVGIEPQNVTWAISSYSKKGVKVVVGSQTITLKAVPAAQPVITINSKFKFGENYVVPSNREYFGDVNIVAAAADMNVTVAVDGAEVENADYQIGLLTKPNIVNRSLSVKHKNVLEATRVSIKTNYTQLTNADVSADINVITVPGESIEPRLHLDAAKALDTEILPVKVTMQNPQAPTAVYSTDAMGMWKVRIIQRKVVSKAEVVIPLTEFAMLDETTGEALFAVDMSLADGDSAKLQAEAVLIHEIPEYERVEYSKQRFIGVLYGAQVKGDIQARRFSGPAPFSASFQFVADTEVKRAARALGETQWFISSDAGVTWDETPVLSKNMFSRVFEKGVYKVKATSFNRHSGAEYNSEVVDLVVYDQIKASIDGPKSLLIGDTGIFTANAMAAGVAVDPANYVYEWSLDRGETYTPGESTFEISEKAEKNHRIMVRVRAVEAPENDRYAYAEARFNASFRAIAGPRIGLTAPSKVEVGKTYPISALARAPYPDMQGEIKGFFTLPDGTEVEGTEVDYIPTQEDEALGRVDVLYTAYVEGFRDVGAVETRKSTMRVWEYVWPEFKLSVQGANRFAPSKLNLNVHQVASATALESPVYTWVFPEGTEVIKQRDGRAEVVINQAGESEIRVTIQDGRGHNSEVVEVLSFEPSEPFVVELPVRGSNALMREPVTVTVRPEISGGHPKDRVAERKFFLNGELLQEGGTSARAELNAGNHVFGFELVSRYGQTGRGEVSFEVIGNQVPVCTISTKDSGSSWRFNADCTDTDGRVSAYNWLIDGVEAGKAKSLSIVKSKVSGLPTVTVTATDDSGGVSEPVSFTVTGGDEPAVQEPTEDSDAPIVE